ncbi:ABC transporter permease [Caloramator proteoclasticus]|uniref:Putative ABC transport system permease protein n=1 Tax=Caloramator proteoclasticus DSM 10124 TaxID=1121262 RepID=A0A1M4XZH9_9CLOT|nr:iron export ABC transporter permease subunit FetB [Caloramator proteoclasticus]SHE98901.1 putative ABC transport system permease protein [Caloramator proteoclasticus DSM 10124]
MNGAVKLSIMQVLSAYLFILILLLIVKRRGLNREKEIIISTTRMTLQLILTGYILTYILKNPNPFITLLVISIMEIFAIQNIIKRSKTKLSYELKKVVVFSMIVGTLFTLFYFILIVINIKPWYNPQYFIPLAGMIIGNSMTGISLGINKLIDGFKNQVDVIECSLMLGASPKDACKPILDNAFDSAILPTINSMVGMGIVFLPGMMTGQILSGSSPLVAIEYQIAIMLGILGSVSISVIIFLLFGYKTFFNNRMQIKREEL